MISVWSLHGASLSSNCPYTVATYTMLSWRVGCGFTYVSWVAIWSKLVNACIVKRASKCFHAVDSTFTLWNLASYYKYFFTHHSMPGPEILKYILMRMRCDKGHKGQNRRTYVRLGHFGFGSLVRQLRSLRSLAESGVHKLKQRSVQPRVYLVGISKYKLAWARIPSNQIITKIRWTSLL